MTKHSRVLVAVAAALLCFAAGVVAEPVDVSATAEIGVLRPLFHDIQIGRGTYRLDYVREGGQELLLPYYRFEV